MDGLVFRAATRTDLPDMAHLFTKRPPAERWERMIRRYELEPNGWYLAVLHGRVVGCCQAMFPRDGDAWLQWMRIDPKMQNSGVGREFIDYVEERAIERGARVLRLSTLNTNGRVHYLLGGLRGYTEWARWTRLEGLNRKAVRELAIRHEVQRAGDADEVMDWLVAQPGFQASFGAVTCPADFRKFVTLDWRLLAEMITARGRRGCMVARLDDEIEGVALYAVREGELRVLQVVAKTVDGGVAAVQGAVRLSRKKEALSLQVAGGTAELVSALSELARKRHDYYVFGKRVK